MLPRPMTDRSDSRALLHAYYAAFDRGDMDTFYGMLTEDVVHDVNQSGREVGREAFVRFMERMNACYRERIEDLVVFADDGGTRGAAEFVVVGEYLRTDPGRPLARGQRYRLAAGAFFEIRAGKIARISNYYDLEDWKRQVLGS